MRDSAPQTTIGYPVRDGVHSAAACESLHPEACTGFVSIATFVPFERNGTPW